jgi:CBS domain-containing protein
MATTEMLTLAQCLRADRVNGLTLRAVCAVSPDDSVRDVLRCMADRRTGCALVIHAGGNSGNGNGNASGSGASGGKLIGIFTERDFLNRIVAAGRSADAPVREVMTPDPVTVNEHDSVQHAVEVMERGGYRHLPVTGPDPGQPLGVLSVKDLVHYLVEYFPSNVYNLPPTPDQTQPAREGA